MLEENCNKKNENFDYIIEKCCKKYFDVDKDKIKRLIKIKINNNNDSSSSRSTPSPYLINNGDNKSATKTNQNLSIDKLADTENKDNSKVINKQVYSWIF